jgi:hypothetical protein
MNINLGPNKQQAEQCCIKYLGFFIDENGMHADPTKLNLSRIGLSMEITDLHNDLTIVFSTQRLGHYMIG